VGESVSRPLSIRPPVPHEVSVACARELPDGLVPHLGERFVLLRPTTPLTPVRRILRRNREDRGFWRTLAVSIALAGAVGLLLSYLAFPPTVAADSRGAERR
jgi:hypothetical protein